MTEMATVEWLGQDPIDRDDDDEWYVEGYKRLYRAFIGANLLFETGPPQPTDAAPYRLAALPLTTGGEALPVFTDHRALHRVMQTEGHGRHQTLMARALSDHMVQIGVGVLVNLGSKFSRLFDQWELSWAAAGLTPAMLRPTESEELTKLILVLRGFLENRSIDSAHITWTVDEVHVYGYAIVLSPVGHWPSSRRQALRDDFDRFVSSEAITSVGLALVMVGTPPVSDHDAMIKVM